MKLRTTTGPASYDRIAIKRRLLVETLCERRVLAALHGVVFDDVDQSWRMEVGETALAQRLVFIDENNSGLPDDGERYFLTDAEGGFAFDGLEGDEQIVRLLSRAPSQVQHFPIAVDSLVNNTVIDLTTSNLFETASGLESFGASKAILLADTGLIHVDLDATDPTDIVLNARPTGTAMLPDGRLLVLANDLQGNFAFTLLGENVQAIDLSRTESGDSAVLEPNLGWASVAVDASGNGVLVPQSLDNAPVELRKLTIGDEIFSSATSVMVAAGTNAIGGGTTTTLLAQSTDGGMALSLWSNSTATLITPEPVTIAGASSILGYNDDSGLVFAWVSGDEGESPQILVLDADANFATLQTIGELDELVAVDTQRSVIFSLSTSSPILRAIDAITTETLARWDLVTSFGLFDDPVELAIAPGGDELLFLVASGIAKMPLTTIDAHRVRTDGTTPLYPLRFAVRADGENVPPRFETVPSFTATQGIPLILGEGTLTQDAIDDDEDPFVVVRASSTAGGSVRITPGGALSYTANPGFVGVDSFQVFLHDGRGASELTTIEITVLPPVEPPEVVVNVNPVPENAVAGFVAATLQTIGLGNRPLLFTVNDPRFVVANNMLIVGQGAVLDFETSPLISATLTVSDSETGDVITATAFTITLSDENDPITDVQPRMGSVYENRPGETIAVLTIEDDDIDEEYTFDVFDNRFEVVNRTLRLRDGVSLDYEMQSEIVVNIIVADTRGGMPYSLDFVVSVLDVDDSPVETPVSIALASGSVVEYVRGAIVGAVTVNGQSASDDQSLSVDDSRFEIVDGVLKLRDGVYLIRADQQEARVVITAQNAGANSGSTSQAFLIEVLQNVNPFHNPENPYDVNADDEVTPLDALLILNAISQTEGTGAIADFPPPGRFWDVNGDGFITPLDALLILNYLNLQNRTDTLGEPEANSGSAAQPNITPLEAAGNSSPEQDSIGPASPLMPTVDAPRNESEPLPLFGPLLDEAAISAQRAVNDLSRLRLSLPEDLTTLVPQRLREFNVGGLFTDGKLELTQLRDQLLALLSPSDWQLLKRLETAIRRTPIDQTTIEAIDRALLAINDGWEPEKTV